MIILIHLSSTKNPNNISSLSWKENVFGKDDSTISPSVYDSKTR